MELTNYRMRYPQTVELIAYGHNWDLHNFATLREVSYDRDASRAQLSWTVDTKDNPWGDPSNTACGCSLVFEGTTRWEVEEGSGTDGDVLAEISDVPQDESDMHEYELFDMWIRLEDGTMIKVEAKTSTLVVQEEPNKAMQTDAASPR